METLLRCLVGLLIVIGAQSLDPCKDSIHIGFPYRSVAYHTSYNFHCDLFTVEEGKWYHFTLYTGGKMPEFCPDHGFCGTQFPIWMNGTHPTVVGEVTDVEACTNYLNCCDLGPKPMKVVLCDDGTEQFYSYKLPAVLGCDEAYCAGNKVPCDRHERWDHDREMCYDPSVTTATPETSPQTYAPTTQAAKPPEPRDDRDDTVLSTAAIIGICLACAAVGAIVAAAVLIFTKTKPGNPSPSAKVAVNPMHFPNDPPPAYSATITPPVPEKELNSSVRFIHSDMH